MKHLFIQPAAALFAFVLFAFSACSKKPEMPILGKWQNDHESLEFFKDGSLEFIEKNEKMMGTWSFPAPGTVRMDIKSQEGEFTEMADFTIQGDKFHYKLKNAEQPDVMKRVRK